MKERYNALLLQLRRGNITQVSIPFTIGKRVWSLIEWLRRVTQAPLITTIRCYDRVPPSYVSNTDQKRRVSNVDKIFQNTASVRIRVDDERRFVLRCMLIRNLVLHYPTTTSKESLCLFLASMAENDLFTYCSSSRAFLTGKVSMSNYSS